MGNDRCIIPRRPRYGTGQGPGRAFFTGIHDGGREGQPAEGDEGAARAHILIPQTLFREAGAGAGVHRRGVVLHAAAVHTHRQDHRRGPGEEGPRRAGEVHRPVAGGDAGREPDRRGGELHQHVDRAAHHLRHAQSDVRPFAEDVPAVLHHEQPGRHHHPHDQRHRRRAAGDRTRLPASSPTPSRWSSRWSPCSERTGYWR